MMKSWTFLQALEFLVPPSTTGSWGDGYCRGQLGGQGSLKPPGKRLNYFLPEHWFKNLQVVGGGGEQGGEVRNIDAHPISSHPGPDAQLSVLVSAGWCCYVEHRIHTVRLQIFLYMCLRGTSPSLKHVTSTGTLVPLTKPEKWERS